MRRRFLFGLLVLAMLVPAVASAQTGNGSLRGYVNDVQGGVLPGVTVTATSPALLAPVTAVSGSDGFYRLINLAPGTYTVSAELAGFQAYKREGVLLRAGANFQVDITMTIGALAETITVSGESPMIEVSKPSNVLNIDGEFQRNMPIQARRNWSDFLELTPGVISRGFDDGSGRQVYFGHGTEHFAHVIQLEGMIASNYHDAQVTYVGMGADMIEDIQVKTGGVDASAPMGVGLVMNVVTKSGGNIFRGAAAYAYQPFDWNGNNVDNCSPSAGCKPGSGGTPTTAQVKQFDASYGGPIMRDRLWFFGSIRRAKSAAGISRTAVEVDRIKSFFPNAKLFDNTSESWQPYFKVTGRAGANHEFTGYYQADRLSLTGNREYHYEQIQVQGTGGSLYGGKLTSVWNSSLTTTFTASYNNKGGNDANTFEVLGLTGPQIIIHQGVNITAGTARGDGRILEGGNLQAYGLQPASQMMLRGDLTWFKEGWGGTHEFQTGFFAAPRNRYDQVTNYVNDGFVLEERRMVDPNNPAAGLVPFHRRYQSPATLQTRAARDRDIGVYMQDSWKPTPRLTANIGVRVDFVRRWDDLFDVVRENGTAVGPRLGFSYLVTKDAKNILRASLVRVHEQVMGRDAVTIFGADDAASQIDEYDLNGDGRMDVSIPTPGRTNTLAGYEFDPNLHQPFVDEFIVGYRKQLPGQMSVDVGGIWRKYQDNYAQLEINGFWPDGPNQPFGGWGRVDPARGATYQQTNNSWSTLNYRALEITVAKNMSHNFQLLAGINRQWQHFGGTWNPRDPARFIQPNAFASDKLLYMPRGNNEQNSLPLQTGTTVHTYGPTWQKYSMRFGGSYMAPFDISTALSYTVLAGPWSGPIVDLLPVNDPQIRQFGPDRMPNGQPNLLATRMRFVYPTRGEGQVQAPAIRTMGLKIGRIFRFSRRQVEVAGNIFNLLNAGNYAQYSYSGGNERFNTANFLQFRNQQPARGFQLTMVGRF
ncbi:MAG: TonB-dependent receptor [Acidobacteria bacterium]|nr:TonB-dependent receptor [Acidobacteriota bacterium]